LIEKSHAALKESNQAYIKTIADIILLCGRQEFALRGDDESEGSASKGNFLELVAFVARHNEQFSRKLVQVRGNASYISPQIQNEIIMAICEVITDNIASRVISSGCFAVLADETKDASKSEQISIILRFVNTRNFTIEERFIGFVAAKKCDA
jgi:hypothetical protein